MGESMQNLNPAPRVSEPRASGQCLLCVVKAMENLEP